MTKDNRDFQTRLEDQAIDRAANAICEGAKAEGAGWLGIFWVAAGVKYALARGLIRLPENLNT